MFDFEKLKVYAKSKEYNRSVATVVQSIKSDNVTKHQLRRASLSIMLNIAEGSGRLTKPDKRRFYIIARGSAFECVAIFDFLTETNTINTETYTIYYCKLAEISKMLHSLIRGLSQ